MQMIPIPLARSRRRCRSPCPSTSRRARSRARSCRSRGCPSRRPSTSGSRSPRASPTIVQPETMLIGRPIEYEMRTPLTSGPPGDEIEQSSIITPASSARIAVERRPASTRTWSSMTCCACSMSTPYSPPTTVTLPQRDVVRADRRCRRDDAADERLARGGSRAAPAPCRADARSAAAPRTRRRGRRRASTPTARAVSAPARPSSPPASAYSSRSRGKTACPKTCAPSQRDRVEQRAPAAAAP